MCEILPHLVGSLGKKKIFLFAFRLCKCLHVNDPQFLCFRQENNMIKKIPPDTEVKISADVLTELLSVEWDCFPRE